MRTILAAILTLAAAGPATAQEWPTRPITTVVPFPAGGPVDLVGRLFAQKLSESLGQQFYVENMSGAGGNIAFASAACSSACSARAVVEALG